MKKQVLLVAAAIGLTFATTAQDMKSKSGHTILPESGDWALGFDAAPLLNYGGNLFNGTAGNSLTMNYATANTIYGKYFLDANTALRGWLRLGFGSTTSEVYVADAVTAGEEVSDIQKIGYTGITLGAGYEMRKGHNRLQGYYGGDLMIGINSSNSSYEYGNTLTSTNTAHTSTFGQTAGLLETKSGSNFSVGVMGVIGVEYFFAPKISIGAEYTWGLALSNQGDGTSSVESFNVADNAVETTDSQTAGGSSFGVDVGNNGGAVKLLFHF